MITYQVCRSHLGKRVINAYPALMSQTVEDHLDHVHVSFVPTAASHLTAALSQVDRLLRVENNRAKHVALQQLRTELVGMAHLVSESK